MNAVLRANISWQAWVLSEVASPRARAMKSFSSDAGCRCVASALNIETVLGDVAWSMPPNWFDEPARRTEVASDN